MKTYLDCLKYEYAWCELCGRGGNSDKLITNKKSYIKFLHQCFWTYFVGNLYR